MVKQYYKVLKKFNSKKDYGTKIRPQYAKCLSILKVGQKVNQKDFATESGHKFTNKNTQKSREEAVYHAFMVGRKIGILKEMDVTELGYSIPYEEFIKLKTVAYFMKQHRGTSVSHNQIRCSNSNYPIYNDANNSKSLKNFDDCNNWKYC